MQHQQSIQSTESTTSVPAVEPHGPGTHGRMRPGRRATVLVIVPPTEDHDLALRRSLGWVAAFEEDCGLALDRAATELYAVAGAADLKEPLQPPRGPVDPLDLDFICVDGRWMHPADCPPCPPDSNGASAWLSRTASACAWATPKPSSSCGCSTTFWTIR